MLAEPDLVVRLRRHAVVLTPVFRRFVPLHRALEAAAASEPSAADMPAEYDAGRLDASTHYAKAAKKMWHRLVYEGGWSDKRFAAFLGDLWVSMLT